MPGKSSAPSTSKKSARKEDEKVKTTEEKMNVDTEEEQSPKKDNQEESKTTNNSNDEEEQEEDDGFQYKWLDNGRRRNGRREYDSVLLTLHGTSFQVCRSDFVLLWGDLKDPGEGTNDDIMNQTIEEIWQAAGCARVEAMWEDPTPGEDGTKAMFSARWFFQKKELAKVLDEKDFTGPIGLPDLLKRMRPREVVASMEFGDYGMNTIGGPARVFFRKAPTEEEVNDLLKSKGSAEDSAERLLPKDAFMCRYSVIQKVVPVDGTEEKEGDKDGQAAKEKIELMVAPYVAGDASDEEEKDDDDDDDIDDDDDKNSGKRRRDSDKENETVDEDDSSDGSSSDEESRRPAPEGEGSITNQGKIRVGPQHQVPVPPYDPKAKIVSRNPTLIWSPAKAPSQEQLDEYFQKASGILTPFAEQQLLVMGTEAFTSIPADQMEELMRSREGNAPLIVSSISTSSSLSSSSPKNTLLRECDADALLKNLHDQNYSVEAAVAIVAASPRDFLTNWTLTERESFDDAFRRHAGSLRMVAKSVSSLSTSKSHCEVVDYHYRFKIPDQFRRYQDKKREQAVRMMECIEARKFNDNSEVHVLQPSNSGSGDGNSVSGTDDGKRVDAKRRKVGSWSETGTSDVTSAVEERRSAAKQLLLDIQRDMGKDKMAEVAGAIISLNQGSERESKEALLRILKNQPQLHQRLVEFLPKRFWK